MSSQKSKLTFGLKFVPCVFCGIEKKEQYECPRCKAAYCSLRCYKCEKHSQCSEKFYQECVKKELSGVRSEGPTVDTFEEHMRKYLDGEIEELPGTSNQGEVDLEGEPLDSDDEDNEYLKKVATPKDQKKIKTTVLESTVDEYELEEEEIERRLTALGLGGDVEQLLSQLSEEERSAFTALAEQIHIQESGLGASAFKSK